MDENPNHKYVAYHYLVMLTKLEIEGELKFVYPHELKATAILILRLRF